MSLAIRKMPLGFHLPSVRLAWIVTALLLLLGTATAAYGFWASITSSSNAATAADTLSPGSKPDVTANGTAVSVTWAGGTTVNGHPATGYTVTRYSADTGGTGTAATGGCLGTVATLTCTEQNVPGGTWYYTITPTISLWSGAESPRSTGISTDSVAPVATVQSVSPTPNAAGWNNTSPATLTVTADDGAAGSGVASITYAVDGGAMQTVSGAVATVPVSGDGTHTVSYFATDNAGNAGAAQSQTVKIDTAAPTAPVFTKVPAYVYSGNVTGVTIEGTSEAGAKITFTASDAGAAHSVPVSVTASSTGIWSATLNLKDLDQGTVTYRATATDAAGNTGTARTATNTKDTVAPAAAQALLVPAYVYTSNVATVSVSGTAEAGGSVDVSAMDGGTALPVTGIATVINLGWSLNLNLTTLTEGTITYSVTVKDAAGNTSTTVTASDTKDTVAPSLKLNPLTSIDSSNVGNYSISGTTDSGTTVSLTVKDSVMPTPNSVPASASGSTWTASGLNLSSIRDTSAIIPIVTVTVTATTSDTAGNIATASATVNKDTPPTVIGVKLTNDGSKNARQPSADSGDTVTLSFSERMDLTKICSGWTASQLAGTATISDSGDDDTLSFSFSGCSIGTVSLGGNYLTGANASFGANGTQSSLSWDLTNNALIIKLGNAPNGSSGAGTLLAGVTAGQPTYYPTQTLTDMAGNTIKTVSFKDAASGLG